MIFTLESGRSIDTDRDLTAPERHVLQKLIVWGEVLASSLEQFREKKRESLARGWNDSGPIAESEALGAVVAHMEKTLLSRLSGAREGVEG